MDLLVTRQVDPVHQTPRTRAYGFFTKGTVPSSHILAHLISFLFLTIFVGCLPRPTSVAGCPVTWLSPRFIGVGSEEARLRAGLRPPPKLHVRISRMQLSRRLRLPRCYGRNQANKVDEPVFSVEHPFGQPLPTGITPVRRPLAFRVRPRRSRHRRRRRCDDSSRSALLRVVRCMVRLARARFVVR